MAAAAAIPHPCACRVHAVCVPCSWTGGEAGRQPPGAAQDEGWRLPLRRVSAPQAALSVSAMTPGASEQHWQTDSSAGAGAGTEDTRDPAVTHMEHTEAGQGFFPGWTRSTRGRDSEGTGP